MRSIEAKEGSLEARVASERWAAVMDEKACYGDGECFPEGHEPEREVFDFVEVVTPGVEKASAG